MKEYLIVRRHLVKAGPHFNSPIREEWRIVGRFPADNDGHAISLAWTATGCEDPLNNLRVYGSVTTPE